MPGQLRLLLIISATLIACGFWAAPAGAAGALVDCTRASSSADAIAGVTFGEVQYAQYRCRFRGMTALPYDATATRYGYDMPAWIIAPASLGDGNGTVVVDPLHTVAVVQPPSTRPSGAWGEQVLGLKILGARFLFGIGSPTPNYTWVGIRWDAESLRTPFPQARYDYAYEQGHGVSPGWMQTPAGCEALATAAQRSECRTWVGTAMVADLADAVRSGLLTMRSEETPQPFALVRLTLVHGQSQIGRLLNRLVFDPPGLSNGAESHHTPLFDGWLVTGAGGQYERWPTFDAAGTVTLRAPVRAPEDPPSPSAGRVMELATEEDIGPGGTRPTDQNEFLRYADAESHRSYEIAGASHFAWAATNQNARLDALGRFGGALFLPYYADSLAEKAAMSGVAPGTVLPVVDASECTDAHPLLCTNPLNWSPVSRALLVALEAWSRDGTPPPPNAWLAPASGEPTRGDGSKRFDLAGNALGGIRLPDVAVSRGRFYAVDPDSPPAGGNRFAGAYVDLSAAFTSHGQYVARFARAAERLVEQGFLLSADKDLLVREAAESSVGR